MISLSFLTLPFFFRLSLGNWPKRPPNSRDVNSFWFLSGSSAWRQSQHWLTQSENNLGSNILTSSTVESDDKLNLRCHYSVSEQRLFYLEDFTANDQTESFLFWRRIRLNRFHAVTGGRVLCSILVGASSSCETACNSGPSAFFLFFLCFVYTFGPVLEEPMIDYRITACDQSNTPTFFFLPNNCNGTF